MASHPTARNGSSPSDPVLDAWGEVSEHNEGFGRDGGVPYALVTFHRRLIECDEVLSNHLGPTTPLRTEIRKLLKEISDRY